MLRRPLCKEKVKIMPKLRKTLGSVDSPECIALMALMETQSGKTLASWAIKYAQTRFLPIYESACPGDLRLSDTVLACLEYLQGGISLKDLKPLLREATQVARNAEDPVAQAAARAVSTACAAVQTPTNALGFLFYGAAAQVYSSAGLDEKPETYDALAVEEWRRAFSSLKQSAVPDEPHPAKLHWNC